MKIQQRKVWHSTDAWRGYYLFKNSIYSGAFLWGDNYGNEEVLREIIGIKKKLRQQHIPYKIVKTRTSNCFNVGVDILVPLELKNQVKI